MARAVLRFLNGVVTFFVTACVCVAALYAGFALWDNQQVYDAAEDVVSEMRDLRARMAAAAAAKAPADEDSDAGEIVPLMTINLDEAEEDEDGWITVYAAPELEAFVSAGETSDTSSNGTGSEAIISEHQYSGTIGETTSIVFTSDAEDEAATAAAAAAEDSTQGKADQETTGTVTGDEMVNVSASVVVAGDLALDPTNTIAAASDQQMTEDEANMGTETAAEEEEEEIDPVLAELKEINPDITGWLTMDGTAIDYPLLQGETNYSYINTDVNGDFALAGSIFLDSRNDENYHDPYSLLYGHNMSKHRMFSDVNLYKDEEFFTENRVGTILLKDGEHSLTTLSCIVTSASDSQIFNPENWKRMDTEQTMKAVQENALYINDEGLEMLAETLEAGQPPRILALSTCSEEFTDARTILLTTIE